MTTQCLCTSVRRLARRMTSVYEAHLAPHGISVPQFSILQRLHQLAPVANLEFAAQMGMDRTTLSRGIKPLIAADWIETVVMPEGTIDKRSFGLQLTSAGMHKYKGSHCAWVAAQAETRKILGPELSDALLSTTHGVYEALGQHAI